MLNIIIGFMAVIGLIVVFAWMSDHHAKFGYWFDKNIERFDKNILNELYGK